MENEDAEHNMHKIQALNYMTTQRNHGDLGSQQIYHTIG